MTDLLLPKAPVDTRTAARPMIVVDDAHVTYRTYASGKKLSTRDSLLNVNALRGGRGLQTVPALRGVSFTASEGETIGVVGHNGSGKSTLFRAMSGLIPTSQGTIWAADRPVLLGVNAALVPELSGENNIKLGLLAMGFTPDQAADKVEEIADFAELNEFLYHPMRTYSSGMGARLRFAIASAKAHSVLLIDEALSVGDRRFKVKSEERIRGLRDSAGVVMIVSHSAGSLRDTCERVLWIHKGELRADGPSKDVIADYIKWTKQPGSSAVGAASSVKTSATKTKSAPATTPAERSALPVEAPTKPIPAATGASGLEQLLNDATVDTTAARPRTPIDARNAARRERYRRTVQEKTKRRVLTLSITGGAILLAIGAGAAITMVTAVPQTAPAVRAQEAETTPPPLGPAAISNFAANVASVFCETPEGELPISLTWRAENAVQVAVAAGPEQVDAIAQPLEADLPLFNGEYVLPFPCTQEAQVYTLTIEDQDGTRSSSAVTVARELPPEPEPEPFIPQPQQPAPAPVEPEPAPEPVPTEEPAPEPEPTEPAPEPTVPVDPEPVPEPEPTEQLPPAAEPIETVTP